MALTKLKSSGIADGAVTATDIAANSITVAQMSRAGTSGQVLTSAGTGADAAWAAAAINSPYFSAYLSSAFTSMVDATWTKLPIDTVLFQTGSTYDGTTNYRWTPGVVGKYQMHCGARFKANSSGKLGVTGIGLYVNGSRIVQTAGDQPNENTNSTHGVECNAILSLDADDYVECWGYMGWYSGTEQVDTGDRRTRFAGYKLLI
jgi:PKD repeat protein